MGNAMRNFSKMIWFGELIEHAIKSKKIEGKTMPAPVKRETPAKKKIGKAQAIFTNHQPRGQASYSN